MAYNVVDVDLNIFPSSNASKKTTSEVNLREVVSRLKVNNFIVNESTGLQLSSGILTIPDGYQVNMDGYLLTFKETTISSVPSDSDIFICLHYANDDLLYGKENDVTYTHGVEIVFTETSYPDPCFQIARSVGGSLDSNFKPVVVPFTSDNISVGNTSDTLTDYINTIAGNTYVSKINPDTKKGSLTFDDTGNTDTVIIDNSSIDIQDNGTSTLKLEKGKISRGTSKIEINGDITITAPNTDIVGNGSITSGTHSIVVDSAKSMIDNFSFNGNTITNNNAITVTNSGGITFSGDVHAARVFNAVFNDIAEMMPKAADEEILPGDVVAFEDDGSVTKVINGKHVFRLAGIVSSEETYGYLLGGEGLPEDQKVPIALCGRVWLNCKSLIHLETLEVGELIAVDPSGVGLQISSEFNRRVVGRVAQTKKINENDYMVLVKVVAN